MLKEKKNGDESEAPANKVDGDSQPSSITEGDDDNFSFFKEDI